jgi:hypothetical protein
MNNNKKLNPFNFKYIYLLFLTVISIFCITTVSAIDDNKTERDFFIANAIKAKSLLFTEINNGLAVNILDLNDSIELRLFQWFINTDKQRILSMFSDESVNIYYLKINPDEYHSNATVAKINFLIIFFIKQSFVDTHGITINIGKEIYSAYSSTFYKVEMYNKNNNETIIGMAPFLNIDNLESNDNLNSHNSFLEFALGSARQITLLSSIENQNIPNILQQKGKYDHKIFQIPRSTFLTNIMYDNNNASVTTRNILQQMYDIVNTVEYLHENKIAHGDIEFINLFIEDNNKIVLSGFERFSMFSNNKEQVLGIKKFHFPAKISSAPEFLHPSDDSKSLLTSASFKGDIWSLGFVLATILYSYYQDCFDISKLKKGYKIDDYFYQQHSLALFFNVIPAKVTTIIPNFVFSVFWYLSKVLNRRISAARPKDGDFQQKIEAIIEIINSCHRLAPEARPTATEIKNKLSELMK